jgi:hypothetical protein
MYRLSEHYPTLTLLPIPRIRDFEFPLLGPVSSGTPFQPFRSGSGIDRMLRRAGAHDLMPKSEALPVDQAIGLDELHWLQELQSATQRAKVPDPIRARLLIRRLIEPKPGGFALTARGRLALAKLG